MENIVTRLRKIFKESSESQTAIAKKTNVSSAYIWKILNKDNISPSHLFIDAVCREFNINEIWLRTGEGEPYKSKNITFSDLLMELENSNDDFIKDVIESYMELDQNSKNVLKNFSEKMLEKYIKRNEKSVF